MKFKPLRSLLTAVLTVIAVNGASAQDEEFPTGAIPTPPEILETVPQTQVWRNFTPRRVDLTAFSPPVGRQIGGSCVGWAVAYAARTQHYAWDNSVSPRSKTNMASPDALYNSTKSGGADCNAGTVVVNALQWMKDVGVPSKTQFPANRRGQCTRKITTDLEPVAARFKIKGYRRVPFDRDMVNGVGVSRIREQLSQRRPVIFSMSLPEQFGHGVVRGSVWTNGVSATKPMNHAMVLVGYDDDRGGGAFRIQNSWGTDWADDGFIWMSYEAFLSMTWAAYVLETRPDRQTPTPRPAPRPDPPIDEPVDPVNIASVVEAYECAGLVSADEQRVSYFAKSEADLSAIEERLETLRPDAEIVGELAPWPQCEARITLKKQLATPDGLSVSLKGHPSSTRPVLTEGDPFVLQIKTPEFPAYIYATYLQADGTGKHVAVHLIQPETALEQYPPGTEIVIGDGRNSGDTFTITGPNFGDEMLVLIASASQLFDQTRPWEEVERDFLSAVNDALSERRNGGQVRQAAASVLPVTTRSRN